MESPAERFIGHTTVIDPANAVLQDLLAIWQTARQGRSMPSRQDLTPQLLRQHLGWLHMLDVIDEPLNFRFRLYGSRIADVLGHDATGKLLSEAFHGDFFDAVLPAFQDLVHDKRPLMLKSTGGGANKEFLPVTSLMLPLSDDDDRVDVVLVRHQIAGFES